MIVGGDAAELGSGPGSYDIRRSVWHVNVSCARNCRNYPFCERKYLQVSKCCNPDLNGGGFWGIFNALLGWQNSATVGSVVSYNLYWIAVALGFGVMICKEKGYGPFDKRGFKSDDDLRPLLANPPR